MRAQEEGGGGFSRRYCLYGGWDKPYIETTGYIIPTLIAAGRYLGNETIVGQAELAARWLLGMQKDSGAFCDTDTGREQVFDTGQVLTGLIEAFRTWGDERFLDAAVRAGSWLIDVQEKDGSWQRYAYNDMSHTYYTKVAASLLQLAQVSGESRYHEAALKNVRWAIDRQDDDGYFRHMEFRAGEDPFLHTIAYVIEGLLDSYATAKDTIMLDAAMKTVAALGEVNEKREMLLSSQYGEHWVSVNRERCITGLAQWAGISMRAYHLTGDKNMLTQAVKTIYYLKSKQYLKPDRDLYGALPGSVPLWGKYLGFCYPNWGVKFFIDALIAYDTYGIPQWKEQETWVSGAFSFSESVVSEELGANDRKYLALIAKEIGTEKNLTVLDIGCGKGKFIRHFGQNYPHWTIAGVDPSFSDGHSIRTGSVYALPVPDDYADVILLVEVVQHIDDLRTALTEVSRVTKEGGCLVIGDRDPASLLGLLKPFMELAGLWMYPWDSPFREQWRRAGQWGKILGGGWHVSFSKSFDDPNNRIPLSNRFYLLIARKKGS
jgi:SAM-dependent methyltransferase